ncbi:MAG: DUF2268 domain-containing putative Zn-dependent protease [Saprospiraceae bacterium]
MSVFFTETKQMSVFFTETKQMSVFFTDISQHHHQYLNFMRNLLFCCYIFSILVPSSAQSTKEIYDISTIDIDHFWEAFDSLAHTKDSIGTMQRLYIDRGTEGLKQFIKARNFTAAEYVELIRDIPAFWLSIRPNTLAVKERKAQIIEVFRKYKQIYPRFKAPKVCFAIGNLRTGGTVRKDYLLIGTEIASADSTTNKDGMNQWLQSVLGQTGDITGMVAHETVHFLQPKALFPMANAYFGHRMLMFCLREGAADFIAEQAIGHHINEHIFQYGEAHEQALWEEFKTEMLKNDFSKWLYNGVQSKGRPADLGYYIGYKICQSYFEKAPDKNKALIAIIRIMHYKRFWRKSGYDGKK